MEKLFENKYTRDKEWAKDVYRYILFRRPFIVCLYVLLALIVLFDIYKWITSSVFQWNRIVLPVLVILYVVFVYLRNIRIVLKRDLEMHGKPIEVILTVTDELIKLTQSTGSEFQLKYEDIKKVVKTKKFIYLWSKTNILYPFKKNSFSFGGADKFLSFLRDKGINA